MTKRSERDDRPRNDASKLPNIEGGGFVDVDQAVYDEFLEKQQKRGMTVKPDRAQQMLEAICDDILDLQIGTTMFWPTAATLRADAFADYVHFHLLEASKAMGWEHHDSSKVWADEVSGVVWPALLRFNSESNVWTAEAIGLPHCIGRGNARVEAISDVARQIRGLRMSRDLPEPQDIELVFVSAGDKAA
jgi:hypothetical protein